MYLLRTPVDIILSNDLDTLPASFLAARLRKKIVVFDSHELFSEVPELVNRRTIRTIWKRFEDFLIPRIDYGLTVGNLIARHYEDLYHKDFEVIRNVGKFRYDHEFSDEANPDELLVIYQGALNLGRGLELLVKSMKFLEKARLRIVGTGDIEKKLKQMVSRLKLRDKVEFTGRLPIEDLWNYTARARVGVSLEEDMGLNYQYALPNKLFDYVQARIPVIVSDLPEMRLIVEKYGIGEILTERTPEALASLIEQTMDRKHVEENYRINLELAARELCWEREEEKLITFFKRVSNPAWEGTF